MDEKALYTYGPDGITFVSAAAGAIKTIYAPLCGADASSLKSAITPSLSGDIKLDKLHYVTKPASREDLRRPSREFFVSVKGKGTCSLAKDSAPDTATVAIGQLWHQVTRRHPSCGLSLEAVHFIPVTDETVELMRVTVKNISRRNITLTPTAAIPIFGRSLANKHDHEHVTALLHRIQQNKDGVLVEPTMVFNEEGHGQAQCVYFVYGADGAGAPPSGTFPTVDTFLGDAGNLDAPQAVMEGHRPVQCSDEALQGKEAVGALRFKEITLKPGGTKEYFIVVGLAPDAAGARAFFKRFASPQAFKEAWALNRKFWEDKTGTIRFKTGDEGFNAWMRWVTLQPILRRIFGCSFLPDHDYGKGGKGWRDIWQDLLSLILIEPSAVRGALLNNCAGIRIDGSNATIIGAKPGEFIADRNAITRVWMDHGCWPLVTLLLYINQSGDFDVLLEKVPYFRDPQMFRTFEKDLGWLARYGHKLVDKKGHTYEGTVLEHILVQNLTQFFNVGEHNCIRLESADWNDGLDMAFARGESAAFTAFYGGNLLKIADIIEGLAGHKGIAAVEVAKEILLLLDTLSGDPINYDHPRDKHQLLFDRYFRAVQPALSGEKVSVSVQGLVKDLRHKGRWLFSHLRHQEKITVEDKGKNYTWFNGYYDNQAQRVEGKKDGTVRMTLTAQVFAIMSGMAETREIEDIMTSVDRFLRDKNLGGYRLNTDFGIRHYPDLGRAFAFAYGTKENGAFFSHMTVMYAYALYERGFARQGHEVLRSITRMAVDGRRSKIYPGIPEYFDPEGRGMYHYLTGSASWFVLTQLTQAFGVRGLRGDLALSPQLVREEFDAKGNASVTCPFAGHTITVQYRNPKKLDAGSYTIKEISFQGKPLGLERSPRGETLIRRSRLRADLASAKPLVLDVMLGTR
ncbi:MAG: cellobiose phosphorylase [Candidatus Omnitrophota bacterium]|nr:cellobiose phosphorylase [Candidatus Omnitrophota bacterium]